MYIPTRMTTVVEINLDYKNMHCKNFIEIL